MFAYNALAAVFRGFGDSTSPLMFVAVACVLNIVGDLALVGIFGMGANGAAIATVFSQGFSAYLAVVYARRADYHFDFKLASMRIKWDKLVNLLRIGLPMAVQFSLTSISFIFILATVSKMGGVAAAAAIGITGKLNGFTMLPPHSFAGRDFGDGRAEHRRGQAEARALNDVPRTRDFARLGVVTFAALFFFPEPVIRIFTPDRELIDATALYLKSFSIDCVLVCLVFCLNGFFNGCGHTTFTMMNNIFCAFAVRVPATWILSGIAGASLFTIASPRRSPRC